MHERTRTCGTGDLSAGSVATGPSAAEATVVVLLLDSTATSRPAAGDDGRSAADDATLIRHVAHCCGFT